MAFVESFLYISTVVGVSVFASIPILFIGICAYDIHYEDLMFETDTESDLELCDIGNIKEKID